VCPVILVIAAILGYPDIVVLVFPDIAVSETPDIVGYQAIQDIVDTLVLVDIQESPDIVVLVCRGILENQGIADILGCLAIQGIVVIPESRDIVGPVFLGILVLVVIVEQIQGIQGILDTPGQVVQTYITKIALLLLLILLIYGLIQTIRMEMLVILDTLAIVENLDTVAIQGYLDTVVLVYRDIVVNLVIVDTPDIVVSEHLGILDIRGLADTLG